MKASLQIGDRVLFGYSSGEVVDINLDNAGPLYVVRFCNETRSLRRAQLVKERGPQSTCAISNRDALEKAKLNS
jgi:hypothetical protein